jgi:hypothetical protein
VVAESSVTGKLSWARIDGCFSGLEEIFGSFHHPFGASLIYMSEHVPSISPDPPEVSSHDQPKTVGDPLTTPDFSTLPHSSSSRVEESLAVSPGSTKPD